MASKLIFPQRLGLFVCVFVTVTTSFLALTYSQNATANKAQINSVKGPSGLPLPRFVSLKFDRVNVRRGPSVTHQVAWVFARKGLPVEIIAEFEHWRRVRDSEGEEGWVFHSLLTGKRTVLVAPWRKKERIELYAKVNGTGAAVAVVEAGALGEITKCTGKWCQFTASGLQGWIRQESLWGIYPGERLN